MFCSKLQLEEAGPGRFKLISLLFYEVRGLVNIIIPKGFVTDFASIPKAVQMMPGFEVNGLSRAPAVLHDFLYQRRGVFENMGRKVHFSRAQVDAMFRIALAECGVPWHVRWAMYMGVRVGGWLFWKRRKHA